MPPFTLKFFHEDVAPGADIVVSGEGQDEVGKYTLEGKYVHDTGRMIIDKKYIPGTGNP